MPLSQNAINTLIIATGSVSVGSEISRSIDLSSVQGVVRQTTNKRLANTSLDTDLLVQDTDQNILYSLSGAPAYATFSDGELLYTSKQIGNIGNAYYLYYDFSLPSGSLPRIVVDSAAVPNATIHISLDQDFVTTIGQLVAAFRANPALPVSAVQTGGSPNDQPNFGGGLFTNGSPIWVPVNNSLMANALQIDGSNTPSSNINWAFHNLSSVGYFDSNIAIINYLTLFPIYTRSSTPIITESIGGRQDGGEVHFRTGVDTPDATPVVLCTANLGGQFSDGQNDLTFYVELTIVASGGSSVNGQNNGGSKGGAFKIGLYITGNYGNSGSFYDSHLAIVGQDEIFGSKTDNDMAVVCTVDRENLIVTVTGSSQPYTWRLSGTCYNCRALH